jgi:hypothetical protein
MTSEDKNLGCLESGYLESFGGNFRKDIKAILRDTCIQPDREERYTCRYGFQQYNFIERFKNRTSRQKLRI